MLIKQLGTQPYLSVWEAMKSFTTNRTALTPDEMWILEHPPVYTQGQSGKPEHILHSNNIPIIQSDRGGQVTYHGPGQLVIYFLIDLKKHHLGIRTLVCKLENLLITLLHQHAILGETRCGAPGVYVQGKKIASIGLRVKNGCTYHGIALNVNMDLQPFLGINPCGYEKLEMTQMADFIPSICIQKVAEQWTSLFLSKFEN